MQPISRWVDEQTFTSQLKPMNAKVSEHSGSDWNNPPGFQTTHPMQPTGTVTNWRIKFQMVHRCKKCVSVYHLYGMIVKYLISSYIVGACFLQQTRSIEFLRFAKTQSVLVVHNGQNCKTKWIKATNAIVLLVTADYHFWRCLMA